MIKPKCNSAKKVLVTLPRGYESGFQICVFNGSLILSHVTRPMLVFLNGAWKPFVQ